MARPKGCEKLGGRQKGTPNKLTGAVKDMILAALERAHPDGGIGYLKEQAVANPVAFMGLVGKVLPLQVTGDGGGPVVHHVSLGGLSEAALREIAALEVPDER